jgi:hypothetical protein
VFEGVINGLLDFLKGLLAPIFAFYIVVTVVYIVAKIFTLIPSFGAGMGAVVVVTAPGNIAGAIQSAAGNVHAKIKDVPVAIIAIYDKLLAIFNLLDALVNLAAAFGAMQTALAQDANAASNKTAGDWADSGADLDGAGAGTGAGAGAGAGAGNIGGGGAGANSGGAGKTLDELLKASGGDITDSKEDNIDIRLGLSLQISELDAQINGDMVACTLPDGSVEQLSPEDCLAAGGAFGNLVSCTLPDGSVQQLSPEACTAMGGSFGDNC